MKILVLYETIFGHNLELSQEIQRKVPTAYVSKMSDFNLLTIKNFSLLVFCPCTYGQGQLTPAEDKFCQQLIKCSLKGISYFVVSIGDRTFGNKQFANAATIFDMKLQTTEATRINNPIKIDYDEMSLKIPSIISRINQWQRKYINA